MSAPAVRPIAIAMGEIRRYRLSTIAAVGQQAVEKAFIPPGLADHPGDQAEEQNPHNGRHRQPRKGLD